MSCDKIEFIKLYRILLCVTAGKLCKLTLSVVSNARIALHEGKVAVEKKLSRTAGDKLMSVVGK